MWWVFGVIGSDVGFDRWICVYFCWERKLHFHLPVGALRPLRSRVAGPPRVAFAGVASPPEPSSSSSSFVVRSVMKPGSWAWSAMRLRLARWALGTGVCCWAARMAACCLFSHFCRISSSLGFSRSWNEAWWLQPSHSKDVAAWVWSV